MFWLKRDRRIVGLLTGILTFVGLAAFPPLASAQTAIEVGITKPADLKPRELRFKNQGLIQTVPVHEGDVVKAGQVLITQDDAEEQAELTILQRDATDIRVQGAKVSRDAKYAELKRIKILFDSGSGNAAELEKAEAEAKLSDLNIIQEEKDLLTKQAKVDKQQLIIGKMQLRSPMNGVVQTVDAHVGEMVDPSKPPVLTIVQNDPLVVEVNLLTAMSQQLKLGQPMRVSYDKKDWKDAKVTYLAPMAQAASGYQTVHLTLANPEGKASGLQIFIELPQNLVAAQTAAQAAQQNANADK